MVHHSNIFVKGPENGFTIRFSPWMKESYINTIAFFIFCQRQSCFVSVTWHISVLVAFFCTPLADLRWAGLSWEKVMSCTIQHLAFECNNNWWVVWQLSIKSDRTTPASFWVLNSLKISCKYFELQASYCHLDKQYNNNHHQQQQHFTALWNLDWRSIGVRDHTPYNYPNWRFRPGVGHAHPAPCVISALVHERVNTWPLQGTQPADHSQRPPGSSADPPAGYTAELSSQQDVGRGAACARGSGCGHRHAAVLQAADSTVLHEWRTSPPDPPRWDRAGPEGRQGRSQ